MNRLNKSLLYCSLLTVSLGAYGASLKKEKVVNNPIIQNMGVCDPHIHIFNDKAYLFASHDRSTGYDFYGMYDWWVWSSPDLVHWTMEFNLFPKDMWCGPTKNCWATDGAERNGKYYFYVSGNWKTGIAVSENGPGGPYHDAMGTALDIRYDPTVFIDDDENMTPYIMTGGFPYQIAKLNEDMISLAEEPVEVMHTSAPWKGDGGFIHKHNGIYYLNGHGPHYSTSENIYGPYTYRGMAYKHWVDHPTFFTWHNQTYCAFGMGDRDKYFRKTHISYVHYRDNGEMVICGETGSSFIGVGQYDCSRRIEAENFFAMSDGPVKKEGATGFYVSGLGDGDYLYFQRVLNMAKDAEISISMSASDSDGCMEIREKTAGGRLIGTLDIPAGGSDYRTLKTTLRNKSGLNNIYLIYKGHGKVDIDWIEVSSTGAIPEPEAGTPVVIQSQPNKNTHVYSLGDRIEAEDLACYYELRTDRIGSGDAVLSYMKNTSYSSYLVDFGRMKDRKARFSLRASALDTESHVELRLGSPDGELIGVCEIAPTGGWQNWKTFETTVRKPVGKQHLFLVVRGKSDGYLVNMDWFEIEILK